MPVTTYLSRIGYSANGSTNKPNLQRLAALAVAVPTAGADALTALSVTIPANLMNERGDEILIKGGGIAANNGNTKSVRVKWGSNNLLAFVTTQANDEYIFEVSIKRGGATGLYYYAKCRGDDDADTISTVNSLGTQNFAIDNTVAIELDGDDASDLTLYTASVDFISAT